MLKVIKSESKLRKGVSSGSSGGSLDNEREGVGYVAVCPEIDVTSQGNRVEEMTYQQISTGVDFFLKIW